jgi:hypothetical protein
MYLRKSWTLASRGAGAAHAREVTRQTQIKIDEKCSRKRNCHRTPLLLVVAFQSCQQDMISLDDAVIPRCRLT